MRAIKSIHSIVKPFRWVKRQHQVANQTKMEDIFQLFKEEEEKMLNANKNG